MRGLAFKVQGVFLDDFRKTAEENHMTVGDLLRLFIESVVYGKLTVRDGQIVAADGYARIFHGE